MNNQNEEEKKKFNLSSIFETHTQTLLIPLFFSLKISVHERHIHLSSCLFQKKKKKMAIFGGGKKRERKGRREGELNKRIFPPFSCLLCLRLLGILFQGDKERLRFILQAPLFFFLSKFFFNPLGRAFAIAIVFS